MAFRYVEQGITARPRATDVSQSIEYYPFGMAFADGKEMDLQQYKYNDKEWQSGIGLYDYHARQQDPLLGGRFTTIDPLAEKYPWMSPYAYCANNPINAFDLHGDSIWYTIDNNIATMHVTGKVINQSGSNLMLIELLQILHLALTAHLVEHLN